MRENHRETFEAARVEEVMYALAVSNELDNRFDDASLERAFGAFMCLQAGGLNNESFLAAHGVLLEGSDEASELVIGEFRKNPALAPGKKLAPPADLIAEYTERAFEQAEDRGPEQTADFLTKLRPFETGNGRMARIVMYVLQSATGDREIIPYELDKLHKIARQYDKWVAETYLTEKSSGVEEEYWRKILDLELND